MDHTIALIQRSHEGDEKARAQLVEENTGLVWCIVKRFNNRGVEAEDLFQVGSIGLLKAIDKFDMSFDVKFSTYAVPMISGAFTINFTLSLINGLKVFDQISVMTDGGPGFATETLVYLLYKVGFNEGRQGFGTAVGIVLLFLIIVLNTIQQKFLRK